MGKVHNSEWMELTALAGRHISSLQAGHGSKRKRPTVRHITEDQQTTAINSKRPHGIAMDTQTKTIEATCNRQPANNILRHRCIPRNAMATGARRQAGGHHGNTRCGVTFQGR